MPSLPVPQIGLVISYSFLWNSEDAEGRKEGIKDRRCAVIAVVVQEDGDTEVVVLPVTHAQPKDLAFAVEIPQETKRRLGLDFGKIMDHLFRSEYLLMAGAGCPPHSLKKEEKRVQLRITSLPADAGR